MDASFMLLVEFMQRGLQGRAAAWRRGSAALRMDASASPVGVETAASDDEQESVIEAAARKGAPKAAGQLRRRAIGCGISGPWTTF
jgi:hypothetical protein